MNYKLYYNLLITQNTLFFNTSSLRLLIKCFKNSGKLKNLSVDLEIEI